MKFVFAASGVVAALLWLTISPSLLVYVVSFLLIWYIYTKLNEPYVRFKKLGFVGPEPTFLLGNLMDMIKKGFFYYELENYQRYRKEGKRYFVTFGGRTPIIHALDPDVVKEITVKEAGTFTDRFIIDVNASPLDLNLLVIVGDHWKHVRSQVTPTFSSGKLRNMTPLIQMAVDKIVGNVKLAADEDRDVDVKELTGGYTLDVIASTLFGLDIDSQKNPNDIFVVKAKKLFAGFGIQTLVIILAFIFPHHVGALRNVSFINSGKDIIDFYRKVVEECLKERKANPGKFRDFLQLMVDSEVNAEDTDRVTEFNKRIYKWSSKGLTTDEILAQAIVFFLAGYETTANTLVFLIYLLCVYPEIQDKVSAEIQEELGDELPNYDNVGKLVYLDQCVNETLRLYPQAPRIDRVPNKNIEIDGMMIEAGQPVAVDIVGMHYDPEYWAEPEKFDPDRFLPEAKAKRHPAVFCPFGIGPRNCVGMRLALLELKMAIVEIMQTYKIIPSDSTPRHEDLKLSKKGICIPETPIKVKFTQRY